MILFRNIFKTWSLLYGTGANLRNVLFDKGVLKSVSFDVPVIAVGNLRVGGTGKTPCAEWLLRNLQLRYKPAYMSRGYGRKTSGFLSIEAIDNSRKGGDEAVQVKKKFPDIPVVVSEDRVLGVVNLLAEHNANVIILDDAFQHRYIRPDFSIILSAFHTPFFMDELLPVGRLRESPKSLKRAQCLIYTKCPGDWYLDRERYINRAKAFAPEILVCFSTLEYGKEERIFGEDRDNDNAVLVTGIADSKPLVAHLKKKYRIIRHFDYPDHYRFMKSDVAKWKSEIEQQEPNGIVLTTEKDAMRMLDNPQWYDGLTIKQVPMSMKFLEGEEQLLTQLRETIDAKTM